MFTRLAIAIAFSAATLAAQASYPPSIPDADRVETYKTVDGVDLKLWIFEPEGHSAHDQRPAIVFYFGGGWRNGTPTQFVPQAKYLASRGMVAMVADYRVANRHENTANECLRDAKAAVRWIRQNALRLGVDANRVAAGGGSAGGHLAAAVATLPGHDDSGANFYTRHAPNALALFNPAVMLASAPGFERFEERREELRERMGAEPESMSPFHHVRAGLPPTIIFHGKADKTVPYPTAAAFCKKMQAKGNRCELNGYEGMPHGFFNHGRNDNVPYRSTVRKMDEFFRSLGWLEGEPTMAPSE